MKIRSLLGYAVSTASALALVIVIGVGVGAQRGNVDWAAIALSTHHVAGTVHYLEGRGGNIGLSVGDDGVLMIDDQYAPLTDRIVETVRGLSSADIKWLINTHVHPDHTGGTRTSAGWEYRSWRRTGSGSDWPPRCPKRRYRC